MSHHADAETVAAVRSGDLDRFRELIERYERQAYAVAWSRLGDPALAEEAVQESFIRAYRFLGWLRDPARFAGWITRITRAVSINLGLRHRRELRRRQRWALDPSVATPSVAVGSGQEAGPEANERDPELLRAAVAALPLRHRECLVLHYLEGRSVADAASALGITPGAFKVRLHRARAVLRQQLERHLSVSLGDLGPRASLAPGIMATLATKVAADPTGTGAGVLAGAGAALAKVLPFSWFLLLVPLGSFLTASVLWNRAARQEGANYTEPTGFRRQLFEMDHRRMQRSRPLLLLAVVGIVALAQFTVGGRAAWLPMVLAFTLYFGVQAIRQIRLGGWTPAALRTLCTFPFLWIMALSIEFHLPSWASPVAWLIFAGSLWAFPHFRPGTYDQNLFLRAVMGWFKREEEASPAPPAPTSREDWWGFARWAAREQWVADYRWSAAGLTVSLPSLARQWTADWRIGPSPKASRLLLRPDGRVFALLGDDDLARLTQLGHALDRVQLESRVAAAVERGFTAWRRGDLVTAREGLGQPPIDNIFRTDPRRTGMVRMERLMARVVVGCAILMGVLWLVARGWEFRSATRRLVPTPDSVQDVRQRLGALPEFVTTPADGRAEVPLFTQMASDAHLLPPLAWFPPSMRDTVTGQMQGFVTLAAVTNAHALQMRLDPIGHQPIRSAVLGWMTPEDWARWREAAPRLRELLSQVSAADRAKLLEPWEAQVLNADYRALKLNLLRWQVTFLREADLLPALDPAPLIDLISRHQVLPGRALPPNRRRVMDLLNWEGLFLTAGNDPIEETWEAVAVLHELGALERIDQEACFRGLMRLHRGRGLFLPDPDGTKPFTRRARDGGRPRASIPGDARTTYQAREILRMLGRLKDVPDVNTWEYRLHRDLLSGELEPRFQPHAAARRIEAVLLRESDPATGRLPATLRL